MKQNYHDKCFGQQVCNIAKSFAILQGNIRHWKCVVYILLKKTLILY